jgi:N-acetylmuramic acid 6-phosphate etherase
MEMKGRNGRDLPQREAAMPTEDKSRRYDDLDLWSTRDAVQVMLEAQLVAAATVQPQAGAIAAAAEAAATRLAEPTGRLIYVGAGTSGRLAVQDGVELRPTFGWSRERMAYLIAGGDAALVSSIEGSEDDTTAGETAMSDLAPTRDDVVVGVAASGTTPYTVAAVREAHARGALTIGIANNPEATLLEMVAHPIFLDTGAEVVAGSTRMKAGTAQKIALNLFSTALMVRLGGVYRGRMVGMLVSNAKLQTRAVEMIRDIASVDKTIAANVLERANGDIKLAVLVALGRTLEQAAAALSAADGNLRIAIGEIDAGSATIQDSGGNLAVKVRKRPGSGPRKRAPRY